MARTKADMQRLIDQRDQLLTEMEALRNKVAGVEMAIALLSGDNHTATTRKRSGKSVKVLLLDMLNEIGTAGLNANVAVELANRKGVTLNSGSASSTLSRFKKDGIVILGDDNKYRLPEFAPHSPPSDTHSDSDDNVRPMWAHGNNNP